jgi:hypothetical protein
MGIVGLGMAAIIYFRFMLVPMTMAYFLTFVLGPMIDFLSQRPLVCLGRVFCKIKKLPRDEALVEWRKEHPTRPMPDATDVEYPFDNSVGRMCHAVPPSKTQGPVTELLYTGQLPFPIALLMMFAIVCATLYIVFAFVQRDLSLVLSDPIFVASLKDVLNALLAYLKNDAGVILDVNVEELLPPPCFPDDPEWVESYPNHWQTCERMSNVSAVRFEGSTDEFLVFLGPWLLRSTSLCALPLILQSPPYQVVIVSIKALTRAVPAEQVHLAGERLGAHHHALPLLAGRALRPH